MLSFQTENSLKFHFFKKFLLQNPCQYIDVYGKNVFNQLSVLKYVKFSEGIQPTREAERRGFWQKQMEDPILNITGKKLSPIKGE